MPLIDWLADLARRRRRRLMGRLVKGADWDAEIKRAQEAGLKGYPVFTRKSSTDVSYIACARRLAAAPDAFFTQFATHKAHTLAVVLEMMGNRRDFELQRSEEHTSELKSLMRNSYAVICYKKKTQQ